jgi:hypothetical protein
MDSELMEMTERYDYQQEEAEKSRQREILLVLNHVKEKCGDGTALFLASNFGLSDEYRKFTSTRRAA